MREKGGKSLTGEGIVALTGKVFMRNQTALAPISDSGLA